MNELIVKDEIGRVLLISTGNNHSVPIPGTVISFQGVRVGIVKSVTYDYTGNKITYYVIIDRF